MPSKASNNSKSRNRFRIIAGQWRGRTLTFADLDAIRPTADRVRETLFNWLQNEIVGSHCLDVFAGSGALGFEALSRGAAKVTSLELSDLACKAINSNALLVDTAGMKTVQINALSWLKKNQSQQAFDIVFLDPPFADELLPTCCDLLEAQGWLNQNAFIYLESNSPIEKSCLPSNWELTKHKKAGKVYFAACRRN